MTKKIIEVMTVIDEYLVNNFSLADIKVIRKEIEIIIGRKINPTSIISEKRTYLEMQNILSKINEKETIRKKRGVYYTPADLAEFILINAIKVVNNKLNDEYIGNQNIYDLPHKEVCFNQTIYDPTCGVGEFLVLAVEFKFKLLQHYKQEVSKQEVEKIIGTIYGNDINWESIVITKLRVLMYVLHEKGINYIKGISKTLNSNFTVFDFVEENNRFCRKFDVIVGNPPYVEDTKTDNLPLKRYGNIYANILDNSANILSENGAIGFVVPLSYISTPRMEKIRSELLKRLPKQYILSFSDRPDSLFQSVHQKLNILIAQNTLFDGEILVYTSNYKYWYKKERDDLFKKIKIHRNKNIHEKFIPKIGAKVEENVYLKIMQQKTSLLSELNSGESCIYVSMRATFWIKAFLNEHSGGEYKTFFCKNFEYSKFLMCILNSSLFWWYWVTVSDCWHVTNKELINFRIPQITNFEKSIKLATSLETKLENTKKYIGSKQTKFEYKHKMCINEIVDIDNYISEIYCLTKEESNYIKNFALKYRIGRGI